MKNEIIEKEMLFVEENKGVNNDTKRPFHVVKLGDPKICESATFFLNQNTQIKTGLFSHGQVVKAFFKLDIYQGRMGVRLVDLLAV